MLNVAAPGEQVGTATLMHPDPNTVGKKKPERPLRVRQ